MKIKRIVFNTDGGIVPNQSFGRTAWIAVGDVVKQVGHQNEVAVSAEEKPNGVLVTAKDGTLHMYPWHTIDKLILEADAPTDVKRGPGRPKAMTDAA
ncbi:MAG: hypothetical protein KGL39_56340 [Patescibacteria group bacterium]|nr:hypothetical protein [Patescibacteria group bacterium]